MILLKFLFIILIETMDKKIKSTNFSLLNDLLHIDGLNEFFFSFFTGRELIKIARTCHKFREIIKKSKISVKYLHPSLVERYFDNIIKITVDVRWKDEDLLLLRNVKYLTIDDPLYFSNLSGENFQSLSKLKKIIISHCELVTDEKFLSLNDNLQAVAFEYCPLITDEGLKKLTNISVFCLKCMDNITDLPISKMTNLHFLTIDNCDKFKGKCFSELKKLKKLIIVDLNNLDNESLLHLNELEELQVINGIIDWSFLKKSETTLKTLTIKSNKDITDEILSQLINVKKLEIEKCDNLCGKFLSKMTKLRKLHIVNCNKFVYDDISNLISLRELVMKRTFNDVNGYKSISLKFDKLTKLKILDLTNFPRLTDNDLSPLTSLEELSLDFSCCLTGNFLKQLTNLQRLKLSDCGDLNINSISFIKDRIKNLEIHNCGKWIFWNRERLNKIRNSQCILM